jgi:ABC-2 type transport system permease protein
MLAIYIKEMSQYFRSMAGYIFLTIMMLICGFLFTTGNLISQNPDIKSFFLSLFNILIFIIPILTMRQFSEEQKLKTQQLLFTLPLSIESIVLGKFFATLSMIGIGLVVTLAYPLILAYLGSSALLVTLGNYLGVILFASMVVAIGLYISSFTDSQVVAAIVSYGIILILWLTDSLTPSITNQFLKEILGIFSLKSNYIEFTYGIFNPAGILYFLTLTGLFLILTMVNIDSRRQ